MLQEQWRGPPPLILPPLLHHSQLRLLLLTFLHLPPVIVAS
jgi:hypothetical protein